MTESETWREPVTELPSREVMERRKADGWKVAAIEWERASRDGASPSEPSKRPIPYGLRISADCRHLEVDPVEKENLRLIVAMIAGDHPLSRIAHELNERGSRTRAGGSWTQLQIFQLLPRIIEFGPEILSAQDWSESKKRVLAVVS
jgi:hypothetical protein